MKEQDRIILKKLLLTYIKKDARILEVGCGIGNNIQFIKELGYRDIIGVDISNEMVRIAKSKNHEVYNLEQFTEIIDKFNLILFSHILEHIEYRDLQKTLEFYFKRLSMNGKIIILSPVIYDAFYNDIDHLKPYYPIGLINLFSSRKISKQYKSQFRLKLIDIYFRKQSLLPYNIRSRYINTPINRLIFRTSTFFFDAIRILSFNILSKKTGYGALFEIE